nr:MAG TPA: protein of unknown function DUF1799 [Caudoviricetes sp.]
MLEGNKEIVKIRHLTINCIRYVIGLGGVAAMGFDWSGIEAICRMSRIRMNRPTVEKLRILEDVTLKYLNKKKEGDAHG